MTKPYAIRKFVYSDVDSILDLLDEVFHPPFQFTEQWWNWKYIKNPAGFLGEVGGIWVAEDKGKIIGHYSVMPYQFRVDNSKFMAGQSVDTAVHPDYRRMGIFSALAKKVFEAVRSNCAFLFGNPTQMAIGGFTNLGWSSYPANEIVKFRSYDVALKVFFGNSLSTMAVRGLLKTWSFLNQNFSFIKNNHGFKQKDVVMQRIEFFDSGIDEMFDAQRNRYLMLDRSATFLNWRFRQPFGPYELWVGKSKENHDLLGYVVLRRNCIKTINVLDIVDIYSFENDNSYWNAALDMCLHVPNIDIVRLRIPNWHVSSKIASRKGFIGVGKFLGRIGLYEPKIISYSYEEKSSILKTSRWFYSWADTDYA